MRYINTLQTHLTPFFEAYRALLLEAFEDIQRFVNEFAESEESTEITMIAAVVAPIIGSMVFLGAIMLS